MIGALCGFCTPCEAPGPISGTAPIIKPTHPLYHSSCDEAIPMIVTSNGNLCSTKLTKVNAILPLNSNITSIEETETESETALPSHKAPKYIKRTQSVVVTPDGAIVTAEGTIVRTDGTLIQSDGSLLRTDGTVVKGDGRIFLEDGTQVSFKQYLERPNFSLGSKSDKTIILEQSSSNNNYLNNGQPNEPPTCDLIANLEHFDNIKNKAAYNYIYPHCEYATPDIHCDHVISFPPCSDPMDLVNCNETVLPLINCNKAIVTFPNCNQNIIPLPNYNQSVIQLPNCNQTTIPTSNHNQTLLPASNCNQTLSLSHYGQPINPQNCNQTLQLQNYNSSPSFCDSKDSPCNQWELSSPLEWNNSFNRQIYDYDCKCNDTMSISSSSSSSSTLSSSSSSSDSSLRPHQLVGEGRDHAHDDNGVSKFYNAIITFLWN